MWRDCLWHHRQSPTLQCSPCHLPRGLCSAPSARRRAGNRLPPSPSTSISPRDIHVHVSAAPTQVVAILEKSREDISPCVECLLEVPHWLTAITGVSEVKRVMSNWGLFHFRDARSCLCVHPTEKSNLQALSKEFITDGFYFFFSLARLAVSLECPFALTRDVQGHRGLQTMSSVRGVCRAVLPTRPPKIADFSCTGPGKGNLHTSFRPCLKFIFRSASMEKEPSETRQGQILADNLSRVPCDSSFSTDVPCPQQTDDWCLIADVPGNTNPHAAMLCIHKAIIKMEVILLSA